MSSSGYSRLPFRLKTDKNKETLLQGCRGKSSSDNQIHGSSVRVQNMWLGREIWVYLQKDLTATYRGENEYNRRVDMEGFRVSDRHIQISFLARWNNRWGGVKKKALRTEAKKMAFQRPDKDDHSRICEKETDYCFTISCEVNLWYHETWSRWRKLWEQVM